MKNANKNVFFYFLSIANGLFQGLFSTFAAVKQKTGIIMLIVAFIHLWACTPSSLYKNKDVRETTAVGAVSTETAILSNADLALPKEMENLKAFADTAVLKTITAIADTDSLSLPEVLQVIDSLAGVPKGLALDTLLPPADTTLSGNHPARAGLKRDTTMMDSLQLAILKYNKVIDDSLRLDSLNRQRKNGIDAPVEFSANDSLIYEAGTGMAHLLGAQGRYPRMDRT